MLFREVLRVLHELLPVLEVLFGQVAPERVLGLGLVDKGHQRLDDLKTELIQSRYCNSSARSCFENPHKAPDQTLVLRDKMN